MRQEKTYAGSIDGVCCDPVATGVLSVVGGFESSSSSCFTTTGASVLCGVVVDVASVLLDRPAIAPPLPPPRADLPTLGFGGIVTAVVCCAEQQSNSVVDDSGRKSYLGLSIREWVTSSVVVTRYHMGNVPRT
jgi:hypothetical protein